MVVGFLFILARKQGVLPDKYRYDAGGGRFSVHIGAEAGSIAGQVQVKIASTCC